MGCRCGAISYPPGPVTMGPLGELVGERPPGVTIQPVPQLLDQLRPQRPPAAEIQQLAPARARTGWGFVLLAFIIGLLLGGGKS